MVEMLKIENVKFQKNLYPRFEANNETINQYRQAVDNLPPILLTKDYVLVDGYHRLLAFKLEGKSEIPVEIFESNDLKEVLIEAIKRNNNHGRQLSTKEKQENAKRLFNQGVTDTKEIASILSVTPRAARDYTRDLRDKAREDRDSEILELYLQCYSFREITEKLNISLDTIHRAFENGKLSEIEQPDDLQFYNVWRVASLSPNQMKYPGQTPYTIVENIIYYFTSPPQLKPKLEISKVVDPMAGSGVVRNVCRKLYRRYMLFDLEPLRKDLPIEQNDILKGFPDKAEKTHLVYFDPPYYNLMEEYPKNAFNESYSSFLKAMDTSLANIKNILVDKGKVALILKPMNEEMLSGKWLDTTFDCLKIAENLGYTLLKRISAPLNTQQFQSYDVTRAKDKRVMLNTLRDILIFERA